MRVYSGDCYKGTRFFRLNLNIETTCFDFITLHSVHGKTTVLIIIIEMLLLKPSKAESPVVCPLKSKNNKLHFKPQGSSMVYTRVFVEIISFRKA